VVWVKGNHDSPNPEVVAWLIGVELVSEYYFKSGETTFMCVHGDIFDDFHLRYPFITFLAESIYNFLQWLDKSHFYAKIAKRSSKTFLRCVERVRYGALALAKQKGVNVVICGHTHHHEVFGPDDSGIIYLNSGCWTENPSHCVEIVNGNFQIKEGN
jgi:UDP-2,3-diacylglucosamine pyrophosphatase LpxH